MFVISSHRFTTPRLVQGNRRASPRLGPGELQWLERVRLNRGSAVEILDLSLHGALFEVGEPLRPGQAAEFELIARGDRAVVSGQLVRTQISVLSADSLRYRGACRFDEPLPWASRLSVGGTTTTPARVMAAPPACQPSPGWHEIKLTFLYGRELRGYTRGFHSSQSTVDLWPSCSAPDRDRQTIPVSLLRKVVFVRPIDHDGTLFVADAHQDPLQSVEVTFRNNDVLHGTAPGYSDGDQGVWVFPGSAAVHPGVFAVGSALREIRFF